MFDFEEDMRIGKAKKTRDLDRKWDWEEIVKNARKNKPRNKAKHNQRNSARASKTHQSNDRETDKKRLDVRNLPALQLLRQSNESIDYYPVLTQIFGSVNASVNAAILISYLLSYSTQNNISGRFFLSAKEIEQATGLTVQQQRSSRNILCGVLAVRYIGPNKKLEYEIFETELKKLILEVLL